MNTKTQIINTIQTLDTETVITIANSYGMETANEHTIYNFWDDFEVVTGFNPDKFVSWFYTTIDNFTVDGYFQIDGYGHIIFLDESQAYQEAINYCLDVQGMDKDELAILCDIMEFHGVDVNE